MYEGKGIMYFNDGAIYEGNFKSDLFEGKGILYNNKGDIYEGDFNNNYKKWKRSNIFR